jgi:hypothetical protein
MSINLPNLDDRTYADLVEEALTLIPAYAPEWTNHNPSDPGITLIELFAYLTEMMIYRLNRVTDENKKASLQLLNGQDPVWTLEKNTHINQSVRDLILKYRKDHNALTAGELKLLASEADKQIANNTLNQNIRDVVLKLRHEPRAVTVNDFERLALEADSQVARAYCLPRRNLESTAKDAVNTEAAGHISVVIITKSSADEPSVMATSGQLLVKVFKDIEPCCLLTTRLHVTWPQLLKLRIKISFTIQADVREADVRKEALTALSNFFHPLTGGENGSGWTLGRNVYVSDIYALLDKLPGVDFVEKVSGNDEIVLTQADKSRRVAGSDDKLVGIKLMANELIAYQGQADDFTIAWK